MKKKTDNPEILLAGDACLDNYLYTCFEKDHKSLEEIRPNWQFSRRTSMYKKPGGVLLISHFLNGLNHTVIHQGNTKRSGNLSLKSYSILRKFKEGIRIQEYLGYQKNPRPEKISLPVATKNFKIICIDDTNNGFSERKESYGYFTEAKCDDCAIFYKLSWPIFNAENSMLKLLLKKNPKQLFFIVNANDLRDQNISISGGLTWELAINDIVIKFNTVIRSAYSFFTPPFVIIRIGLEGVLVLQYDKLNNEFITYKLFYIPKFSENSIDREIPGTVQGLSSLFTASLIRDFNKKPVENSLDFLQTAIVPAMELCIAFLHSGYKVEEGDFQIPGLDALKNIGLPKNSKGKALFQIRSVDVPRFDFLRQNRESWSILEEETSFNTDYDIACEYVNTGHSDALSNIPIVDYGGMRLIDRREIEKYRSIKNLIEEYIDNQKNKKPLNIGVFGPPGSGKSFGVKQIAFAVLGEDAPVLEYNLSQFRSQDELIDAFHCIRDYTLSNKAPLVFFDEFDATYQGSELGWLKFFLAPMQDGEFMDKGLKHPLGKAIFIFAGGTCKSFSAFSKVDETDRVKFRNSKGPDFISRLKGYVDILGVNPVDITDDLYIIRRAIIMRKNFERNYHSLLDFKGRLHININVLRALLMIPCYKHDNRSLNALVEMSSLTGKTSFDESSLPTNDQMEIHVNSRFFLNILNSSYYMASDIPGIAEALHNDYLKKTPSKRASHAWNKLSDYLRGENIKLAEDISLKLFRMSLILYKDTGPIKDYEFSQEEIEILARWEHKRWNKSKMDSGWRYGPKSDDKNKLHDRLQPWESLTEDVKELDRNTVTIIPKILKSFGWAITKI